MTENPTNPTTTDDPAAEPFPLDEEGAAEAPLVVESADAGEGEPEVPEYAGGDPPREEAEPAEEGIEGSGTAEPIDVLRSACVVESLMLISAQPLSFDRIGKILGGLSRADVKRVIAALKEKYPADSSGIVVEEINRAVQFRTNPANQDFVRKMFEVKPVRFSRAALETLAIIAYRQPITRQEMEEVRGVDCAGALKTLMERRLVRVMGKKNVAGKPFIFGTTREFMEVFGLGTMSDLPSLRDIEDYLSSKTEEPQLPELPFPMDERQEAAEMAEALDQSRRNSEAMAEVREAVGIMPEEVLEEAALSRLGDLDDGFDEDPAAADLAEEIVDELREIEEEGKRNGD